MTERGLQGLARDGTSLSIGPSSLRWDGSTLTIRLDEMTVPWPSRIRGTIRLRPAAVTSDVFPLDAVGRHRWWPIAPCSTIEVDLDRPDLHWSGPAYLDSNTGDEPLEAAFRTWDWSRAIGKRETTILYDVRRRAGDDLSLVLTTDQTGAMRTSPPPPLCALPTTAWGVRRTTRVDVGDRPSVLKTFENAPFYARSMIASRWEGEPVIAMHESLSLDRFVQPVVQAMLPFRMPRRLG